MRTVRPGSRGPGLERVRGFLSTDGVHVKGWGSSRGDGVLDWIPTEVETTEQVPVKEETKELSRFPLGSGKSCPYPRAPQPTSSPHFPTYLPTGH